MDEYDDLDNYNGETTHDMWVDYDHYKNTGEPDVFDEEDIDEVIDELNDWDQLPQSMLNLNTYLI